MASIQSKSGKNNKKTYYVVVSLGGKHKWLKAGTKQNAKILKKQIESLEESKRVEKLGLVAKDMNISVFLDKYSDYVKLHTSAGTFKRYHSILKLFKTYLELFNPRIRLLSQIKTTQIEDYQQKRLTSLDLKKAADGKKNGNHSNPKLPKPQTVNYEIGVLRSAFIWAKEREYMSHIPTKKVKKLKPRDKREPYYLPPEEVKLFLKTAREIAKENKRYKNYLQVYIFILNSGLRSGEICNLTWDDIDLELGIIKIQPKPGWTPKTYARDFYLNNVSLKMLEKMKIREGYVFKSVEGNQFTPDMLRNALIRITKKTGLPQVTRVHDLRHTFISNLQHNGVDRATVAEIVGHEDESTTKIYSHTYKEHMKRSINKVGVK